MFKNRNTAIWKMTTYPKLDKLSLAYFSNSGNMATITSLAHMYKYGENNCTVAQEERTQS